MRAFVAGFLAVLASVAALNFAVDPSGSWQKKPAEPWPEGRLLCLPSGLGGVHRAIRVKMIRMLEAPDLVILGSSRAAGIGNAAAPGKKLLNLAVPGGGLKDYVALWQVLKEEAKAPNEVVLAADPWILNPYGDTMGWRALEYPLTRFLTEDSGRRAPGLAGLADASWRLYYRLKYQAEILLSFRVLGKSVRSAMDALRPAAKPQWALRLDSACDFAYGRDGAVLSHESSAPRPKGQGLGSLPLVPEIFLTGLKRWRDGTDEKSLMRAFALDLKQRRIRLNLWCPPIPRALEAELERSMNFRQVEALSQAFYRGLESEGLLHFLPRRPADAYGLSEEDFYDGNHLVRQAAEAALKKDLETLKK